MDGRHAQRGGEPLSASGRLAKRGERDIGLGTVAYHARELFSAGGLTVEERTVRRRVAVEQFYRLSAPGELIAELVAQLDGSELDSHLR